MENLSKSSLRELSLVKVGLNSTSVDLLADLILRHRRLALLDISWNSLVPKAMKKLLECISKNRRLENINLSFNQIADHKTNEKE